MRIYSLNHRATVRKSKSRFRHDFDLRECEKNKLIVVNARLIVRKLRLWQELVQGSLPRRIQACSEAAPESIISWRK